MMEGWTRCGSAPEQTVLSEAQHVPDEEPEGEMEPRLDPLWNYVGRFVVASEVAAAAAARSEEKPVSMAEPPDVVLGKDHC